jgi:hypothetical protein
LNDGLKLDLNKLARSGTIRRGGRTRGAITWTSSYWGELATAVIVADMTGERFGRFCVTIEGGAPEQSTLIAEPRRYGGVQWYFVCPMTGKRASVLWRPNGARRFASRHAWGPRRVAYRSQFCDRDNRAHIGQNRIKQRLLEPGMDPEDWELPSKPKWMRWQTYWRYVERFDYYDGVLDEGVIQLAAKFMKAG